MLKKDYGKLREDYSGKDKPLDYCLKGMKDKKQRLFDHILEIPLENEVQDTVKELEEKAKSIDEGETQHSITSFECESVKIEPSKIFQEKIIGKENLSVSELIEQLDNSDWVKEGFDKYVTKDNKEHIRNCPFCQEQTITVEFIKKTTTIL